jgi:putative CocE/NonD family hydrolase
MSDTYDLYGDLIFPGGMFNQAFLQGWSGLVYLMDRNTTVAIEDQVFTLSPVDEDPEGDLLAQAVAQHADNLDTYASMEGITFRDQPFVPGVTLDHVSTGSRIVERGAPPVAVYHWGSWMDAGSADGVIRRFMSTPGPARATIGAWSHDLWANSSPYVMAGVDPNPPGWSQWEEALVFFDDLLRKGKPLHDRTLRYFTLGESRWKSTHTWPIPGTQTLRLYLREGGRLTEEPPDEATGEDLYQVDFQARSSLHPRWLGPLFDDAWYPSRRNEDLKTLVYETLPLEADLEVTGYPVVNLNVASTHTDGAFIVYLEDVATTTVRYTTEGVLRGIHRKVGTDPSPWPRPTPYHSFRSEDAEPLVPGEVAQLSFGLQPISVLFRAGHRIRIAIAGHDYAVFRRVPAQGTPHWRVQRNSSYPSYIDLPVVPREDGGS